MKTELLKRLINRQAISILDCDDIRTLLKIFEDPAAATFLKNAAISSLNERRRQIGCLPKGAKKTVNVPIRKGYFRNMNRKRKE